MISTTIINNNQKIHPLFRIFTPDNKNKSQNNNNIPKFTHSKRYINFLCIRFNNHKLKTA